MKTVYDQTGRAYTLDDDEADARVKHSGFMYAWPEAKAPVEEPVVIAEVGIMDTDNMQKGTMMLKREVFKTPLNIKSDSSEV